MKIGLKGETIFETMFLATGILPEKAFAPFFTTVMTNAVLTAQRLNLFELLATKPLSVEEVAETLDTDQHATKVLLEALTAFGYVSRENGRFEIDAGFQKSLHGRLGDAAQSILRFAPDVAKKFELLDQAVRTGSVENFHFKPSTETSWPHYLSFLKSVSGDSVKSLLKNVKLTGKPEKMLDVAGGPAQYSIGFCKQYPSLKATILDLPESAESGKEEVENAGLSDRISYVEGDFFQTEWGDGYDFALLSNILHVLKDEQCEELINRTFNALKPGGIIVTNDVDFPDEEGPIDFIAGATSLLYFTMTGARTHPTKSIENWISEAGFTSGATRKHKNSAQVSGTKPG
ncbi:MAG: methyltransferase [Pseudomonadota bacterium]